MNIDLNFAYLFGFYEHSLGFGLIVVSVNLQIGLRNLDYCVVELGDNLSVARRYLFIVVKLTCFVSLLQW